MLACQHVSILEVYKCAQTCLPKHASLEKMTPPAHSFSLEANYAKSAKLIMYPVILVYYFLSTLCTPYCDCQSTTTTSRRGCSSLAVVTLHTLAWAVGGGS